MKKVSFLRLIPVSLVFLLISSCASTKNSSPQITTPSKPEKESISLLFAGDVMAHTPNFKNTAYDKIWRDISPLVSSADLSFANIEAPVADSIPWSSYPQFNMHSEYVEEAIKAGFNVFSLANNHTNDQYLDGIKSTKKYFDSRKKIWACGVKEKSGDSLTYKVIEKKGWKVLFVAITEILNRNDYASYIDYYPSSEKKRAQLIEELKALHSSSNCDLFVLSVHTDEPEYILKVTENHKAFFKKLIEECKINIIWANHPHVVKPYEKIGSSFVMYANGNTISAQRTNPKFSAPETERDYTGDGLILKLKATKNKEGEVILSDFEPHLITTYITPGYQYVIKLLDDDFISALDRSELTSWAKYLVERKKLMENVLNLNK